MNSTTTRWIAQKIMTMRAGTYEILRHYADDSIHSVFAQLEDGWFDMGWGKVKATSVPCRLIVPGKPTPPKCLKEWTNDREILEKQRKYYCELKEWKNMPQPIWRELKQEFEGLEEYIEKYVQKDSLIRHDGEIDWDASFLFLKKKLYDICKQY